MATVPHPVPSRIAHAMVALCGVEDDTLLAWQRACAEAAEALRPQPDEDRLRKALTLAQDGHVTLEDDGFATVESHGKHYEVQADGRCACPDAQHRGATCKHALAVQIHDLASAGLRPGGDHRQAPTAAPSVPPPRASQAPAHRSAAWQVHEAPLSTCLKLRLGPCEWTHTVRASDETELRARFSAFQTLVHEMAAELNTLALQLEASHLTLREALERQRAEAHAAPPAPAPPPAAPAAPAALSQPDLQVLLQQALQQALAAANGHGTPPPAPPSSSPAAAPERPPLCPLHHVAMELRQNQRGSWWSHRLADGTYCKGK